MGRLNRLARPNSKARTGTGKIHLFPVQLTTSRIEDQSLNAMTNNNNCTHLEGWYLDCEDFRQKTSHRFLHVYPLLFRRRNEALCVVWSASVKQGIRFLPVNASELRCTPGIFPST